MANKRKRTRPIYNTAFKLEVISKVLDGTFTKQEAQLAYRIGGKSTILEWIRQLVPADEKLSQSVKAAWAEKTAAQKQIVRLQSQLKAECLRGDLYKKMVEQAEQDFNIEIKKK